MPPRMVLWGLLFCSTLAHAGEFVRLDPDSRALQTGLVTYSHPSGVTLTLVTTVHLAEPTYYAAIASYFDHADSVIYEGIIRRPRNTIDLRDSTAAFGLQWQLKSLRVGGNRFVVGDLTEEAFARARREMPVADLPRTRLEFAGQILDADQNPQTRAAADGAFAIPQRDAAAIEALRHRLARGDRSILMLYGVAHGNDLEDRLSNELGFTRTSCTWLTAFSY